jgi:hypothetical protein
MSKPSAKPRPVRGLVRYFLRLGLFGFGGPAGRIPGRPGRRLGLHSPQARDVAALGARYVCFGGLAPVTAIFHGVSPAVFAPDPKLSDGHAVAAVALLNGTHTKTVSGLPE